MLKFVDLPCSVLISLQVRGSVRNLRNLIQRWLDRMKPSAQIAAGLLADGARSSVTTKLQAGSSNLKRPSYHALFKRGLNK